MTLDDIAVRAAFAADLVREAGVLALAMQDDPSLAVEAKGVRDFVTVADTAVERLIVARLTQRFGDAVIGEEFGGADDGPALWIVDPIDGTYNYMHANPRWCVSLGLLVDGVPELGFIYAPQCAAFYCARRGHGATRNGQRLAVSSARFAAAPLIEVGCSSRRPLASYLKTIGNLMSADIETRRCGSGALGLAQVATGEIDGYVEHHINSWDVAAGLLLVTEAGGAVNDFFAGAGIRDGNPVLAAAPWLSGRVARIVGIDL